MNRGKTHPILEKLGFGLRLAADLAVINLLWIVCSLPIITIGASSSAAYAVLLRRVRMGEIPIIKTWVRCFKTNFKQAVLLGLLALVMGVFAVSDASLGISLAAGTMKFVYIGAACLIGAAFLILVTLGIPQQAVFDNSLQNIIKNAFALAAIAPGRMVAMWLVWFACLGPIVLLPWNVVVLLGFLWVMWGFALPAWINAKLITRVFAKIDPVWADPDAEVFTDYSAAL